LYTVWVVCGVWSSPNVLDASEDVPDVLEEPLLNFLRISRAFSLKDMAGMWIIWDVSGALR
jgi:hypothetical protein